ncbi:diguanylate cyclase [Marinobacterium aestuariivivens]|uniref:diguanylate cyclase n=1 Tax=Marinobacterium aestuariivivens TaxID=1698799 RepID=A0ABW1ZW07_9GAMM
MSRLDARYLRRRLLEAQHEQTPVALAGTAFVALCAGGYYWWRTEDAFFPVWLLAAGLIVLFRLGLYLRLEAQRARADLPDVARWQQLYSVSVVMAAISWAAIGLYVELTLPFSEAAFIYVCLAGMVAGSVASTASVSPSLYLLFSAITLLPLSILLLVSMLPQKVAMGLICIAFFVFTQRSTFRIYQVFEGFMSTNMVNEQLLRDLRKEQRRVLKLNDQLRQDLVRRINTEKQLRVEKQRAETLAEKLYELSSIDGLTEIPNRRYFDELLADEWSRALRTETVLSLIICDIDYFKDFNDHYGHLLGDECLKAVAHELDMHARRAGDSVARFGGEEFAVLLPGTSLEDAMRLADQMREAVKALGISHRASKVSDLVTISMGVASLVPSMESNPRQLLKEADEALYLAKDQGRDRVVCAA